MIKGGRRADKISLFPAKRDLIQLILTKIEMCADKIIETKAKENVVIKEVWFISEIQLVTDLV